MYEKKASQHTSSSNIPSTKLHYHIIREAVKLIYAEGEAFTRQSFAKKTGLKDNRHTAAVLQVLVDDKVIRRIDVPMKDGSKVATYIANFGQQTTEALYRHVQNVRASMLKVPEEK